MMILERIVVLICCWQLCDAIIFDYYTAKIATAKQLEEYKKNGNLGVCTIDVEPCCATERRRVDGSCNNPDYPGRGTYFNPPIRVLPACFYNGSYSRKAVSGKELELPRIIRTTLMSEGKVSDNDFTQCMTSFSAFMFTDVGSIHDILFFLQNRTDCCGKGMGNYQCTPNIVPRDDPIHRMTGITCLNLTRPLNYQYFGCTKDFTSSPVVLGTGAFDLSQIYNLLKGGDKAVRSFKGGKLTEEIRDGKTFPPTGGQYCPLNEADEAMCFANHANLLMPISLFTIWFVRQHNYFATQLAKVNPCWDDETLFQVARDMNIAFAMNMFLYEWLAQLIGYDNLVKAGVLCKDQGFRDVYDDTLFPAVTLEYTYILRWFHTAQETTAQMFDTKGRLIGDYPMFNLTFRPGYLAKNNHMEYFTQGQFRQPCGKIDYSCDYEVTNNGLPGIQRAVDLPTSDLHKGRLLGMRPYIDYLHFCTGHKVKSFKDLLRHLNREKIYELKKVYKHVADIDLLAGMWVEKTVEGGKIPRTLACLMIHNVLHAIRADRHWFERPNRPYHFTRRQLHEIRKSNLALLLCKNGDSVTEIQRHAFLTISPENPVVKCSQIPSIDFTAWKDPTCSKDPPRHCQVCGEIIEPACSCKKCGEADLIFRFPEYTFEMY